MGEQERLEYDMRKQKRQEQAQQWAARQAERAMKEMGKQEDWESSSQSTASTAPTRATLTSEEEDQLQRMVAADNNVRRYEKKLREIAQLEVRSSLDTLQKAKIEKKHEYELELNAARGLALARARQELQRTTKV